MNEKRKRKMTEKSEKKSENRSILRETVFIPNSLTTLARLRVELEFDSFNVHDEYQENWKYAIQRPAYEELLFELLNSFDLMFTKDPRRRFAEVTEHFKRDNFQALIHGQVADRQFFAERVSRVVYYSKKREFYIMSKLAAAMIPELSQVEQRMYGFEILNADDLELLKGVQVDRARHFIEPHDKNGEKFYGCKATKDRDENEMIFTYQESYSRQIMREHFLVKTLMNSSFSDTGVLHIAEPLVRLNSVEYLSKKARQAAYVICKVAYKVLHENNETKKNELRCLLFATYTEQWLIYKRGVAHLQAVNSQLDRQINEKERHERHILNFTMRTAPVLPANSQVDLLVRQGQRQWRRFVLAPKVAYEYDDNFDSNGEYTGPPRFDAAECKEEMNRNDARMILPVLSQAIFEALRCIRRGDASTTEQTTPSTSDELALFVTIWSIISTNDESTRIQFPTAEDQRKYYDQNKVRYPEGHEVMQTVEEYYERNFGAWLKLDTNAFYTQAREELMAFEDIPGYAEKIVHLQQRDKFIHQVYFSAPDFAPDEWKQIVEECKLQSKGVRDKALEQLYIQFAMPWETFSTFHDDIDEFSSFEFIEEHYTEHITSQLDTTLVLDNVDFLVRNIRQVLESGNVETLATIFNLFRIDDLQTQGDQINKFVNDLARSIGDALRQIVKGELKKWSKKAGFGWKSTMGRLTNSKRMLSLVSENYTRFEQLLKSVLVDGDGIEMADIVRARRDAFINILRDYDRITVDEKNKTSLLALNVALYLLDIETPFTAEQVDLVSSLARVIPFMSDQNVFYNKVAARLRNKFLELNAESSDDAVGVYLDNVSLIFKKVVSCEHESQRSGEFRRESNCVIHEFVQSRRHHRHFVDTVRRERSAEDYERLEQIGFNVIVFPQLNDSSVTFKTAYEHFKPPPLIGGSRREFTRIYQRRHNDAKRNVRWIPDHARVEIVFSPGIKVGDSWRPSIHFKQFTIKCNALEATALTIFAEYGSTEVAQGEMATSLQIESHQVDDILKQLIQIGLLLKKGETMIAVNDEFNDTVKTIDLHHIRNAAASGSNKVAATSRVANETVDTIKKNRLLYLRPAVIRVLKKQHVESQHNKDAPFLTFDEILQKLHGLLEHQRLRFWANDEQVRAALDVLVDHEHIFVEDHSPIRYHYEQPVATT